MIPPVINILHAEWLGEYRIRVDFDDGTQQTLDFLPFLQHSSHPDIRAYLQPEAFKGFHLEHGELVWGDYELCFPVIDLYRNNIDVERLLAQAA